MSQRHPSTSPEIRSMISKRFLGPGFEFWFADHGHIRSPFPCEIMDSVRKNTSRVFFEWISGFRDDEISALNENELVEMFETILFNEAIKLVEDEDQRLTILYPFLPRSGDRVDDPVNGPGKIVERKAAVSKDQKKTMTLVVAALSGSTWETQFELTD